MNLVVIPRYSFLGAAWTTLGTEVFSALVAARIVWRRARFLFWSRPVRRIASAGGILLLVGMIPLPLVFRIAASIGAYLGMLWIFGVLTPGHLATLLRSQRLSNSAP